jgi:hypothetical protein
MYKTGDKKQLLEKKKPNPETNQNSTKLCLRTRVSVEVKEVNVPKNVNNFQLSYTKFVKRIYIEYYLSF